MDDSQEKYEAPKESRNLGKELGSLLNRFSVENKSNTPDFILAQYLMGCLQIFATAVQQRETWHGRDPRPTHTRYGVKLKQA